MAVRGIIFDVDGTLIDSNMHHAQAFQEAFEQSGFPYIKLEQISRLIGMGGDKLIPAALGRDPSPALFEQISKLKSSIFAKTYLRQVRAFTGSRQLLHSLHSRGLQLTVASSASRPELDSLLRQGNLDEFFAQRISADHVQNSKPDPDIVVAALNQLKLPVSDVLMIGDTPYDIQAARRSGVRIIALRCGGWDDKSLSGAVDIFDDPSHLHQNLTGILGGMVSSRERRPERSFNYGRANLS